MSRRAKPTAQKRLEGTYRKDRQKNEAKPDTLKDLEAPETLSEDAADIWDNIAPRYARLGLLTEADTEAFGDAIQARADYLRLLQEIRSEGEVIKGVNKKGEEYVKRNPKCLERDARYKVWEDTIRRFGGNPSDRGRIDIAPDNQEDDLDQILRLAE